MVTTPLVGYGDISPVTPVGRLIAIALICSESDSLNATLAGSVAAFVVNQDRGNDLEEMAARLERVERLLVDLKGQRVRRDEREDGLRLKGRAKLQIGASYR